MRHDEDSLLERFRATGDPAALAELYDRTAAEVLRVAMHVARDPAHAEDLVQATFLAAIESAERYDPRRPARAWLLGILSNCAKAARRREVRTPDPLRIRHAGADDPAAAAERAEFTAEVDAAIERLPSAYQPVMRLHLKHQLTAAEIAHVLGRPPGTVRKQVVRALEMLRRALPAGLGAAMLACVTPARGLAAVREVVVMKATAHAAAASGGLGVVGAAVGAGWMKKNVVVVVACLAIAVGGWVVVGGFDGFVEGQPPPDVPVVAAANAAGEGARANGAAPEREQVGSRQDRATGTRWRVRGSVAEAASGAPVPSATVVPTLRFDNHVVRLGEARSDDAGGFDIDLEEVRLLPPLDLGRVECELKVDTPRHHPVTVPIELPHRDPERELRTVADAELKRGVEVRARVVDAMGAPASAARLSLRLRSARPDEAMGASASQDSAVGAAARQAAVIRALRSANRDAEVQPAPRDADGWTRWLVPEPGGYTVVAGQRGIEPVSRDVEVDGSRDVEVAPLVLQGPTIRGTLRLDDGSPAAHVDVEVAIGPDKSGDLPLRREADEHGRFAFVVPRPGTYTLAVTALCSEERNRRFAVDTDMEVDILLADLYQLAVRFEDEGGRRLQPFDGMSIRGWGARHRDVLDAVHAGAPLPIEFLNGYLVHRSGGAGAADGLLIEAGGSCWISSWVSNVHGAATLVRAEGPRRSLDVALTIRRARPTAGFALELSSDGRRVGEAKVSLTPLRPECLPDYDVELRPQQDGTLLGHWMPGPYLAKVEPAPHPVLGLGPFAAFSRTVELVEGRTTVLREQLSAGGHVRFRFLTGSQEEEPIRGLAVSTTARTSGRKSGFVRRFENGNWEDLLTPPANVALTWAPLLPPGEHVFTITSRDHVESVVRATIRTGETTEVDVVLTPR